MADQSVTQGAASLEAFDDRDRLNDSVVDLMTEALKWHQEKQDEANRRPWAAFRVLRSAEAYPLFFDEGAPLPKPARSATLR